VSAASGAGRAVIANRRLIPIEQSKEILNRRLGASNVLVASRVRGPLTPELLRRGLDLLQRRHPRLRSTIEGPDEDLHFRDDQAAPIPLRVGRYSDDARAEASELEELNRPIDSRACLLRATLLLPEDESRPRRLILLSHHAAVDGYSLVELLEDLVHYCGRLHAAATLPGAEVEPLRLLPSAHDMMPADLKGLKGRVGTWIHARRARARLRGFRARTLPIERLVPLRERTSGAVRRLLCEEHVRALKTRCEESGASMHGVLSAALLFAAALRMPAPGPGDGIPVVCRSSVSLRQKVQPAVGRKDLGLLASFLLSYHRIRAETTLDSIAAEVLEQLWLGYRNRDMFRGLQGNMKNTDAAMRGNIPVTVFVTNLGEPGIDVEHGPFRIEEVDGLPAGAAFAGVLGLASVTVNDRLSLGFFFSRPSLSDATVAAIADDTIACLVRAAKGDVRFGELAHRG
jgi:hypothetical protein